MIFILETRQDYSNFSMRVLCVLLQSVQKSGSGTAPSMAAAVAAARADRAGGPEPSSESPTCHLLSREACTVRRFECALYARSAQGSSQDVFCVTTVN